MIFVITGTQLPFPRLVGAMNQLAPELDERVVAQIGPDPAVYPNLESCPTFAPRVFATLFQDARLIVAHAGIGTVLSARRYGKPLILIPRRHALGEHRNDHQVATARSLEGRPGLYLAWDEADLSELTRRQGLVAMREEPGPEAAALTSFVTGWLEGRK